MSFEMRHNPTLEADVQLTIADDIVSASLPYGTDLSSLVASFTTTGERVEVNGVTQESGVTPNDFALGTVAYQVFAEDGSSREYIVEVRTPRKQEAYIKASSYDSGGFGISVTLSGDGNTLAVGGFMNKVYVFTRAGNTWTENAVLVGSNTEPGDTFGISVALSADGQTLAAGARGESSAATGINGDGADNSALSAGAVYVFARSGATWTQQAYVKASNTDAHDGFGEFAVTLSGDGNTLAVGATGEDSAATGIDGNQADNAANAAGAVYVFVRASGAWTQQAYLKGSNTEAQDLFGHDASLSTDGNVLAIGANGEDSAAKEVGGNEADNSAPGSGAVYIFTRTGTVWSQQAYIKASNTEAGDQFGVCLALSGDGTTLAVTAPGEDSHGLQDDNSKESSGAAYVFRRSAAWAADGYLKARAADVGDMFGTGVDISSDGHTVVVGAWHEDSAARGIDGDDTDNTAEDSGAAYVFSNTSSVWGPRTYLKASNTDPGDSFGFNTSSIALADDGITIAVGAPNEQSLATGINGDQSRNDQNGVGAVYVFR